MINLNDIKLAYQKVKNFAYVTPVLSSSRINQIIGAEIYFKAENFQKVGAFKFRGAINALSIIKESTEIKEVVTHSSGNHAQALALASKLLGLKAYIVMPENSPEVKINAVKEYGGKIIFCKPTLQSREDTAQKVIVQAGAEFIHPYNDYRIIAGQGTCALEALSQINFTPDFVITPVGGGGLLSGTAITVKETNKNIKVIGAEPKNADDANKSFKAGYIIPQTNPNTIADGLRTSLGNKTFDIIKNYVDDILLCSEKSIIDAMLLIYESLKIVIEPSAAVPLATIIENNEHFKGYKVLIILSGGNIDIKNFKWFAET